MADQSSPDPGASGAGGAGQAAPVQPAGQGQPQGFNWGIFPNVPEEHRPLLEPHLRGVQGHVTQLEQQLAPFKAFSDAGLTPEATQGLLQFSADFDREPRAMWIRLGEMLQESGEVDPDVDLEYLAAIAAGEDPDPGPGVEQNGAVPQGGPNPNDPLMQQIEALQGEVQQLRENGEQERARRTEAIQDQLLNKRMDAMRETLKQAGWPEELLSEETLTARIIAHRGQIEEATKAMVAERSSILKGFTQSRPEDEDLELPNGAPPTPDERSSARGETSWDRANKRAEQRLRQRNRGSVQA